MMNRYIICIVVSMFLAACASNRSEVPQDVLLADQGYQELARDEYDRAEATLKVALSINPDNPYALLNLGVLYQNTGRLEEARDMYRRIITLNPDATAVQSTASQYEGKRLVDIAKQNLAAIGYPQD